MKRGHSFVLEEGVRSFWGLTCQRRLGWKCWREREFVNGFKERRAGHFEISHAGRTLLYEQEMRTCSDFPLELSWGKSYQFPVGRALE